MKEGTTRVRIPRELVKWCVFTFEPMIKKEVYCKLTESQIITHVLLQMKANWTGQEYEFFDDEKGK